MGVGVVNNEGDSMSALRLQGKSALVTGASRGIGEAIATELAAQGAAVVLNYLDRQKETEAVAARIRALGGRAHVIQTDVSEPAAVSAMFAEALATFGQLDILVNNAGITADRSLKKMSDDDWRKVIETNLGSVFWCSREALRHMMERRTGAIVNISSIIGQTGGFGQANYAAAKAGVIGITKTCALESARYNITVNAICPGYIQTAMLEAVPEEVRNALLQRIPLQRFGTTQEIAAGVRFLVTDGIYMTGQCLNLNGGLSMG